MADGREFHYEPAGPVIKAFHESRAFVRGIRGCVGSGKTTGNVVEIFRRSQQQAPGPDGIRRTRFAVIRNTEPQLKSTTLRTFIDIIPAAYCKLSYDSPITMRIQAGDLDCEIIFIALDNEADTRKLLSLELTGVFLNEARELPRSVLDLVTTRVGRYPSANNGGCTWSGVIMDTNPPDTEHWWYQLAEVERPRGWEFFAQPSGLAENAENLHNLNQSPATLKLAIADPVRLAKGREYYARFSEGKSEDWLRVYVRGQYGISFDGRPVFNEYSDVLHTAKEPLAPLQRGQIIVGVDFGLGGSAAVFVQRDGRGRYLIVHELIAEDVGVEQFGHLLAMDLHEYFADNEAVVWCDPAGNQRSQLDERTAIGMLKSIGLPAKAAPTNDVLKRLEAVRRVLGRLVEGVPGLVVCPECIHIRRALAGGYHYRRVRVSGGERFHDTPEKNEHSHVADALQYALLGAGEGHVINRGRLSRPAQCLM